MLPARQPLMRLAARAIAHHLPPFFSHEGHLRFFSPSPLPSLALENHISDYFAENFQLAYLLDLFRRQGRRGVVHRPIRVIHRAPELSEGFGQIVPRAILAVRRPERPIFRTWRPCGSRQRALEFRPIHSRVIPP